MSKRIQEAMDVIREISIELIKTKNTDVERARIKATKKVALAHKIEYSTVHDKITRQFGKSAEEFDSMLRSNLFEKNDILSNFLLSKAIDDYDKSLIKGFFCDIEGKLDFYLMDRYGHDENDKTYMEGKWKYLTHEKNERNQTLVKDAKKKWREDARGNVKCKVCDFSFKDTYGDLGEHFIEAHHETKYVSEMGENTDLRIEDLEPVCSNCHAMIHVSKPWKKIDDLKAIIKDQRK